MDWFDTGRPMWSVNFKDNRGISSITLHVCNEMLSCGSTLPFEFALISPSIRGKSLGSQSTRCDVFVDCKQDADPEVAFNNAHRPSSWGSWWCFDGTDDPDKLHKLVLLISFLRPVI